jgi:hypothetical protein
MPLVLWLMLFSLAAQAETLTLTFPPAPSATITVGAAPLVLAWPSIAGLANGNHSANGRACIAPAPCSEALLNFYVTNKTVQKGAVVCFNANTALRCLAVAPPVPVPPCVSGS